MYTERDTWNRFTTRDAISRVYTNKVHLPLEKNSRSILYSNEILLAATCTGEQLTGRRADIHQVCFNCLSYNHQMLKRLLIVSMNRNK